MIKLRRAEGVNVNLRVFLPDVIEQIQIIIDPKFWVMTALHQNLDPADGQQLIDLLVDLIMAQDIMIGVPLSPVESAEFAINVADVCVIDVAIDDICDNLVAPAMKRLGFGQLPPSVCQLPELS